jgi:hypothetical protein
MPNSIILHTENDIDEFVYQKLHWIFNSDCDSSDVNEVKNSIKELISKYVVLNSDQLNVCESTVQSNEQETL